MSNDKSLAELEKSLTHLSSGGMKQKHVILAGDFNSPDIDWGINSVRANCTDRNIHQKLIDITQEVNLTQIHTSTTRENSQLDLVFTSNPSLVKSSVSAPGIYLTTTC